MDTESNYEKMDFNKTEALYYAVVLLFGCLGGLGRVCRDPVYAGFVRAASGVASSGIISFGVVALWIGRSPDSIVGPFYYLAVATFVGYFTLEITEYSKTVIKSIIRGIFKKFGFEVEDERID